ncbi:MAG: ATP-binding protein [Thermodesulfobacteriota bacterium]
MRIGVKLLLAFIPLAILTAMVAEVLYINSKWISESSQMVREVYQNYAHILEMRQHEKNYLFYREKFYLYRLQDLTSRLREFFFKYKNIDDQEIASKFQQAQQILNQYQLTIDQLLSSAETPAIEKILEELFNFSQQLERLSEQIAHIAWIPIQTATRKAQNYSTIFAIQAALIGIVLAFYLSQLLVKPIKMLVSSTKKVAAGDFSQRVNISFRDEIGELAASFNAMVASLEQSQASLSQSHQELRKIKETLENIVQSSVDGIIATDPKGRITFANRSIQEMLGEQGGLENNLLGRPMAQLYLGGYGEAQKIMSILKERGRLLYYETSIMVKDRVIPILISASLLKDERGEIVGTLGIIKDLTEKKKLEDDLRRAQEELSQQEKLAAVGRLAAGVAHEMNDPLTSILTFSNLLREETREGDSQRESLDIIIKEASRARKIVSDLLSFSRQTKPVLSWIDLNEALNLSLLLLAKQGSLEGIDVHLDLANELPLIRADAGQMQQVFTNILLNSIHGLKSPGNGEKNSDVPLIKVKKIIIQTQFLEFSRESFALPQGYSGPLIRVIIQDNGLGIPRENLSRVFDPFFTTKPTGEGTGLGLYIVSGILKNYGANYRLESEEGKGTTFIIDFPLSRKEYFAHGI